jgi:fatty acid desaturase
MEVKNELNQFNPYRNTFYSSIILTWQLCFSSFAIYLSLSDNLLIWLIGQNLLAINMLQWFFIEHDLGHHGFMPFKKGSAFFGHVASLFCLLPYYPWQQVHHAHHKWTGWREKDPTIPEITFDQLSKTQIKLINFCWKYWVPIFAISFALQTFWNLKRLKRLFPDSKSQMKHALSVFFILFVFIGLIGSFGTVFFKCWLLAIFLFFFISDPILLSQHTHLDYHDIEVTPLKPVRYIEQSIFCRSVVFPKWVEKYVLYNTSKHGLHHQYPWVTFYDLPKWKDPEDNYIDWREWLKIAKNMPGHEMIFHSTKHTGIRL